MRKCVPLGTSTLVERQDIVDFNQLDFYYKDHPEQLGDNPVHYLVYAQRLFLYIMRRYYLIDMDSSLFRVDINIKNDRPGMNLPYLGSITFVLPMKKSVNKIIDWYVDHHYDGFFGDGKAWKNFFKGIASWWRRDIKDDYDMSDPDDTEHPYLLYTDTGVDCFRLSTANHVQKDWFDILPHKTFKRLIDEDTMSRWGIELPSFHGLYRRRLPIIEERILSGMLTDNIDVEHSLITYLKYHYNYCYNEPLFNNNWKMPKNTCFPGEYVALLRLKEPVHQFVVDCKRFGSWIEHERYPCTLLSDFIRYWEAKGVVREGGKAIYFNNKYKDKFMPYFYDVGIRGGFIKTVIDASKVMM